MKIDVITSFDQKYYDLIGQNCVESWLQHWPKSLDLTCYLENMRLPARDRLQYIEFSALGPSYESFQDAPVKGRVHTFAKKAYSFIHAMHFSRADRIIWIDADVITKKPLPMDLIRSILPDTVLSTHMGVTYTETKNGIAGTWLVPETGVFAINTQHPAFVDFRRIYSDRYHQRQFDDLRRSYDNDVYGAALKEVDASVLDLCANLKKSYKTPLKHTVLGEYLHHYKAKHSKDWFQKNQAQ